MSEIREIEVEINGEEPLCLVEYESEYERPDRSVGHTGGYSCDIVRIVVKATGAIVTDQVEGKTLERLTDWLGDCDSDERESDAERRQAAAEDAWDAKRHGD